MAFLMQSPRIAQDFWQGLESAHVFVSVYSPFLPPYEATRIQLQGLHPDDFI